MKRVFRCPSPAMVVAIVALIVALGGSALAGGVLTKKKVKNIANNAITQRAPGLSVANAKGADSAKSADSATTAGRATNLLGAKVDSDGSLLSAQQAGTTSDRSGTGTYSVTFPRDIDTCSIVATPQEGSVQISALPFGAANRVSVNITNSAGNGAEDAPFSVLVLC
jgi:hypothetical protein